MTVVGWKFLPLSGSKRIWQISYNLTKLEAKMRLTLFGPLYIRAYSKQSNLAIALSNIFPIFVFFQ